MSRNFIISIITLVIIAAIAAGAVLYAKGLRRDPTTGNISGTGIISITSLPDQATVYLDGHFTTATPATLNSLQPKEYTVTVKKEGFIDWNKKVQVREGLVSEIKATLYKALPSIYPLTDGGAENVELSPDGQKIAFVVPTKDSTDPLTAKKSGIWVWQMSQQPLTIARGAEPHQIAVAQSGNDYTKAQFRWSPDSSQILVTLPDRKLLLDATKLNDPPRDVTVVVQPTLKTWADDQNKKDLTRLQTIKDSSLRQTASSAAVLKWAPDESKILYCSTDCDQAPSATQNTKSNYKVVDLSTNKTYEMPLATSYSWTPDSDHIVLAEAQPVDPKQTTKEKSLSAGKIAIVEYDGDNQAEIYGGNFDPGAVIPWPDGSRLVIVSSFPTASASQPNLYGLNLK